MVFAGQRALTRGVHCLADPDGLRLGIRFCCRVAQGCYIGARQLADGLGLQLLLCAGNDVRIGQPGGLVDQRPQLGDRLRAWLLPVFLQRAAQREPFDGPHRPLTERAWVDVDAGKFQIGDGLLDSFERAHAWFFRALVLHHVAQLEQLRALHAADAEGLVRLDGRRRVELLAVELLVRAFLEYAALVATGEAAGLQVGLAAQQLFTRSALKRRVLTRRRVGVGQFVEWRVLDGVGFADAAAEAAHDLGVGVARVDGFGVVEIGLGDVGGRGVARGARVELGRRRRFRAAHGRFRCHRRTLTHAGRTRDSRLAVERLAQCVEDFDGRLVGLFALSRALTRREAAVLSESLRHSHGAAVAVSVKVRRFPSSDLVGGQ